MTNIIDRDLEIDRRRKEYIDDIIRQRKRNGMNLNSDLLLEMLARIEKLEKIAEGGWVKKSQKEVKKHGTSKTREK